LAGVVLAAALLVLPGATARKLRTRLAHVLLWSLITATLGVIAGLIVAFELNWPPGPGIVVSLCLMYAGATAWQWSRRAW
ncbi:MAG: metal ABC transporter permease, partial [Planctomycetota bacterium]